LKNPRPEQPNAEKAEEAREVELATVPKSEPATEVSEIPLTVTHDSEEIVKNTVPDIPTPTEKSLLAILEGEIDRLIEDGLLIGFDHYEKLKARCRKEFITMI